MYERSCFIVRVVLWIVSVACGLLLVAGAVLAAPAPLGGKAVPVFRPAKDLAGTWMMQWQTGAGCATFSREGGYCCDWCGQRWIGSWRVEEDPPPGGGPSRFKLIVTESQQPDAGDTQPSWYTWEVSLEAGKPPKGRLSLGGEFSLTPRKTPKPDL
jgi:hypothetical protein